MTSLWLPQGDVNEFQNNYDSAGRCNAADPGLCHHVSGYELSCPDADLARDWPACAVCHDVAAPLIHRHGHLSLQQCTDCGYVNLRINELISGALEVVRSPEYRALLRLAPHVPALARALEQYALLVCADDPEAAGWSLWHAAGLCDELGLGALAGEYRAGGIDLWIGLGPGEYAAGVSSGTRSAGQSWL